MRQRHDQTSHDRSLTSQGSKTAFDVSREPESIRQKYGNTVNAMSMMMARRLVEAGVPFVTVDWYHKPLPELL